MATTSLGAGVSWGSIDAMLYILVVIFRKHRYTRIACKITSAKDEAEALATIQSDLEDSLVGTLDAEDQKSVYHLVLHAQRRSNKAGYTHQPKSIRSSGMTSLGLPRYSSPWSWPRWWSSFPFGCRTPSPGGARIEHRGVHSAVRGRFHMGKAHQYPKGPIRPGPGDIGCGDRRHQFGPWGLG